MIVIQFFELSVEVSIMKITLIGIGILCLFLLHKQVKFVLSIVYMFYLFSLTSLFGRCSGYYDVHKLWSEHLAWFFNVNLHQVEGSSQVVGGKDKKVIFFINHRCWADFFVNDILTNYSSTFLARGMLFVVFPTCFINLYFYNSLIYFVRGSTQSKADKLQEFFTWIENVLSHPRTYRRSIVVYPESHRNNTPHPLPLKHGFIRYAYDTGKPIQIICTFGLEGIISEKRLQINWSGADVSYTVELPIFPQNYKNYELFREEIEDKFKKCFYKTYHHSNKFHS